MKNENFNAKIIHKPNARVPSWHESASPYGHNLGEAVSALIKEMRRGNDWLSVYWAHQLAISGEEAEAFLWERFKIFCAEDVGMANTESINVVCNYEKTYYSLPSKSDARYLISCYTAIYLAKSKKSRYADELFAHMIISMRENILPPIEIPDYALDHHLPRGKEKGRDLNFFYEEATKLENESFTNTSKDHLIWLIDYYKNKKI